MIEQERIEVIETPDAFAEGLLFPRHKYPKVPFIVKMHGPLCVYELFDKNLPEWARRFMFRLERRLLLKATHVTVPSQTAGEVFRREMDLKFVPWTLPNPPPIVNAPNGAGESEDPNLVLFVGRIAPVKGIHVLIEAIPRILDVQPDTRFVIAGGEAAADHRFDASKRSLLAKLPEPCQAAVSFTGHLSPDAVVEYYKRASVCVLPSLFDTFAYTCLEAMNYGRAVVGSCNSGMRELLDDGRAGLLYTPPDAVELASQIVRLLREPRLRLKLGDRARERALAEFGKERTLDRTLEFYYRAVTELRTLGQERRATRQSPAHHCNVNPPSR